MPTVSLEFVGKVALIAVVGGLLLYALWVAFGAADELTKEWWFPS